MNKICYHCYGYPEEREICSGRGITGRSQLDNRAPVLRDTMSKWQWCVSRGKQVRL